MKPKSKTVLSTRAGFDQQNLEAARIIAADPRKYPAGSLPAVWARLTLAKENIR